MGLGMMVLDDLRKKEGGFGLTARPVGKTGTRTPVGVRSTSPQQGNTGTGTENGNENGHPPAPLLTSGSSAGTKPRTPPAKKKRGAFSNTNL